MYIREKYDETHNYSSSILQKTAFLKASISYVYLLTLFMVGLLHWIWFFHGATFTIADWGLTHLYNDLLRDAFAKGIIPYLMNLSFHYTDHYLGNPETPISPPMYTTIAFWQILICHQCLIFIYHLIYWTSLYTKRICFTPPLHSHFSTWLFASMATSYPE